MLDILAEIAKTSPFPVKIEQISPYIKLGTTISMLQSSLPNNQSGFPVGYIKPDGIPLNGEIPPLETITVPIDYIDGFPICDGLPIWERIDCEPMHYYNLFKSYRNQIKSSSTRSLKVIAQNACLESSFIHAISGIYHWQFRCKAFDAFNNAVLEREREYAVDLMCGKYKKASEELFELCVNHIKALKNDKNVLEKATLKEVVLALKEATDLEKFALGINISKQVEVETNSPSHPPVSNTFNFNLKNSVPKDSKKLGGLQAVIDILDRSGALKPKVLENKDPEPIAIEAEGDDEL